MMDHNGVVTVMISIHVGVCILNLSEPLDLFLNQPIIGRNNNQMNTLFSLSLIVILIVVLIIKDLFVVRMATVRTK
jgi:hypothetical protein